MDPISPPSIVEMSWLQLRKIHSLRFGRQNFEAVNPLRKLNITYPTLPRPKLLCSFFKYFQIIFC